MLCVTTGLDVLPLLYAVSAQPLLWNQDTVRTAHPGSVHKDVSDILLFFQEPAEFEAMRDGHECVPRPAYWALPEARPLIFGLMNRIGATRLGRVMITKLVPGAEIAPHTDSASQTDYYLRHHVVLCGPPECVFTVEDEQVAMMPGSCWWVDNSKEHSVFNGGMTERISLIVDLHVPLLMRQEVPGDTGYGTS